MEKLGGGPFNLARCFGQLAVMAAQEALRNAGAAIEDALDCFGMDAPEDAEIKSEIWERVKRGEVA